MDQEKYSIFKSLGKSQLFLRHIETIDFSENVKVICDLLTFNMHLIRKIDFNNKIIKVMLSESDILVVYSDNFYFCIKERKGGFCYIDSNTSYGIDFCRENNIIVFLETMGSSDIEFPTYKIEINRGLKLNFNDLPENITNYFKQSRVEDEHTSHKIMFLDLEFEII
jgi:hypothetical protein